MNPLQYALLLARRMKYVWFLLLCLPCVNISAQNHYYQENAYTTGQNTQSDSRNQYRLRPNDLIHIQVFQERDLEREVRIEADGSVVLPLIGKIKIGGMTKIEATSYIEYLYDKDYIVDPQVTVNILQYKERKVHVIGQVMGQGFVIIPPGETLTLSEAIAGAGGFTLRANRKQVKLRRMGKEGKGQVYQYNIKEILENPKAKDPQLIDGDTITVPESVI